VYWTCPNFYVYNAPQSIPFRILLTQFSGSGATDLFVGNSTVLVPSSSQNTYSSIMFGPIQVIDVPKSANTCGVGNATCPWYIAVAAYNPGFNLYSIVVKDSFNILPVTLLDGQPQSNLLLASSTNSPIYDYYNITITPGSSLHGLTISLDSYYGEGDVFVTLNDNSGSWPSLYNSFASASGGNNLLYLSYADSNFLQLCPFNAPCKVAIAVTSQVDYLYTVTASTDATPTSLVSGIAASGLVQQGYYAYFNFTPSFQGDFTIYVTSISGDPDMYISVNQFTAGVVPSVNNYVWAQATDQDEVQVIKTTDTNYRPPPSWYIIGVYGYSGNTSFSILAQMNGNNITSQLSDGVAQAGIAAPHSMAYFTFQLPRQFPIGYPFMGVDFAAIPQSGDCDIYISNMSTTNANGQVT